MSLFIVLLQIFRVVVIQPCEFKTRHLRKQQGNLQFCYNFSSVLSQVKGLPVAKSHKKILFFKCSSTPERKVPQRSDASQNDHKIKGYPSKTSEAKRRLKAPCTAAFEIDFQKSDFPALVHTHLSTCQQNVSG